MSGFLWLVLAAMFVMMAALATVPERFVRAHLRAWRRLGVHPAAPDGFAIAMYRIVGIGGMFFVAILAVAGLAGMLPPAGGAA